VKTRTISLTLAAVFAAVVVCFAADVNVGNWKVNVAKSKSLPSDDKNTTTTITPVGDSMKVTIDGVDATGKPFHDEWTGKFDGKDYPVTGDPDTDTRAYKAINDHTLELIDKKDGKVVDTPRVTYSADGKTRTVTGIVTNTHGTKIKAAIVYDKQ
jgi:hypothetical protein